ncbi:hypothetical protein HKD37_17G048118 [Glycine soja]
MVIYMLRSSFLMLDNVKRNVSVNGDHISINIHVYDWVNDVIEVGVAHRHIHQLLIVATYPSAGGRRVTRGCVFQERNTRGVVTNVYLRKMSEKPEKT